MNGNGHGKRNELVQIKVSAEEKQLIRKTALKEQLAMTTWARAVLLKKAQQLQGTSP